MHTTSGPAIWWSATDFIPPNYRAESYQFSVNAPALCSLKLATKNNTNIYLLFLMNAQTVAIQVFQPGKLPPGRIINFPHVDPFCL